MQASLATDVLGSFPGSCATHAREPGNEATDVRVPLLYEIAVPISQSP